MNLDQYRAHPIRGPVGRGWRVLSKFQVFLLWFGGFLLATDLALIITGLYAGQPLVRMMSPMLGSVVAIGFVVQALRWSPRPEDYEDGQG